MAIRVRRGLKQDFDPNKLLSGELATPLDTRELYAAFAPGDVQRLATYENIQSMVTDATEEVVETLTVEVNAATESAQTATQGANTAATHATTEGDYAKIQGDYAKAQGDAAASIVNDNIATPIVPGNVRGGGDIVVDQTTGDMTAPSKLDTDGDSKNNTVTFTEAIADADIASGDTHATLFSKLAKRLYVIKDTLLSKLNIGDDYRPNLLNNGDFQVWQRREAFVSASTGYVADRWWIGTAGPVTTVSKISTGGLQISNTTGEVTANYRFQQNMEVPNELKGKLVTLSFKCKSTVAKNIGVASVVNDTTVTESKQVQITTDWKTHSFTFLMPSYDIVRIIFGISSGVANYYGLTQVTPFPICDINFAWVKLEVNDHATPFIPRSYGEELAMCQRYFQRFNVQGVTYPYLGNLYISAESAWITIDLPTEMRISPAIIKKGNWGISVVNTEITNLTPNAFTGNKLRLNGTLSSMSGLTVGVTYQVQGANDTSADLWLDAEI